MDPRWWRLLGFLCIGRALDIVSTFVATPDLAHEVNPIVVLTGGGWLVVCAITASTVALCMSLYAFALRHESLRGPGGLAAMAHDAFGPGVPAWHLAWRWPSRGRGLFFLGWWVVPIVAVGTFPVFLHNLAVAYSPTYSQTLSELFDSRATFLAAMVAALTTFGTAAVVAWRARPPVAATAAA